MTPQDKTTTPDVAAELERIARELDGVPCRYTVGPGNEMRVIGLLHADIAAIATKLREFAGLLRAPSPEEPDVHVIALFGGGWTMQHPLSCRPNLFDCPVGRAANALTGSPMPEPGRWVCDVDDRGVLTIGREATVEDLARGAR